MLASVIFRVTGGAEISSHFFFSFSSGSFLLSELCDILLETGLRFQFTQGRSCPVSRSRADRDRG